MFSTFGPYVYYPDKNFYLSVILCRKTTLIANFVGGKGANPRTYNEYNFFPHTTALPRPLFHTTGNGFALLYVVLFWPECSSKWPECTSKVAAVYK